MSISSNSTVELDPQSYDYFMRTVHSRYKYDDGTKEYADSAELWFEIEGPQTYGSNWDIFHARFNEEYGAEI